MIDIETFQNRMLEQTQILWRLVELLEEISKKLDCPGERSPKSSLTTKSEEKTAGSVIWDRYSASYLSRHGVAPVRNAKTNALCKQLVQRLGEEASDVAAFFPTHPDPFYARARHPLDLLLRDAEKIRTDWKTRRTITTTEAKGQERVAHAQSQIERIRNGEI